MRSARARDWYLTKLGIRTGQCLDCRGSHVCGRSPLPCRRVDLCADRPQWCGQDNHGAHGHGFTEANRRVRLAGQDITQVAPHLRPGLGIGYAPEDRRLFSAFTVDENVLLPARVAKLDAAKRRAGLIVPIRDAGIEGIGTAARRLGLRRAGENGGPWPRALMLGTRLIILDEPFQGLAPVLAQRYAEALKRLRATGQCHHIAELLNQIRNCWKPSPTRPSPSSAVKSSGDHTEREFRKKADRGLRTMNQKRGNTMFDLTSRRSFMTLAVVLPPVPCCPPWPTRRAPKLGTQAPYFYRFAFGDAEVNVCPTGLCRWAIPVNPSLAYRRTRCAPC